MGCGMGGNLAAGWERPNADRQIDLLYRSAPSSLSLLVVYAQDLGDEVGVAEALRLHLPIPSAVTCQVKGSSRDRVCLLC